MAPAGTGVENTSGNSVIFHGAFEVGLYKNTDLGQIIVGDARMTFNNILQPYSGYLDATSQLCSLWIGCSPTRRRRSEQAFLNGYGWDVCA